MSTTKNLKIIRSGVLGQYDRNDWPFTVSWSITGRCPYRCSYCYERDSPKRSIEPDLMTLISAIPRIKKALDNPLKKNKQLRIRLFGGEPTSHKSFIPLLYELRSHFPNASFSCLSNAYRPLSFMEKVLDIDPNFIFNISIHFESVDEGSLLEKIAFLTEKKACGGLSLQFLPSYRIRIRNFAEILTKNFPNRPFSLQFLRSRESGFKELMSDYTFEDHEWAKSISKQNNIVYFIDYIDNNKKIYRRTFTFQEAFHPQLSNFKGAHCIWSMQRLTINENGVMSTGFCLPNPRINIFVDDYNCDELNTEVPKICNSNFCKCQGMRDAAKFFDSEYAPIYLGGKKELSHDTIEFAPYPDENHWREQCKN